MSSGEHDTATPGPIVESRVGGFLFTFAQETWKKFTEHVSIRVSVAKPNSASYSGEIVIARHSGTPIASCTFPLPVENHAWRFLQQGTRILVCNDVDGTSSRLLIDVDTKIEADTLLSLLQQYSVLAKQELASNLEMQSWMQTTQQRVAENEVSLDETTATADELNSTVDASLASFTDFGFADSSLHLSTTLDPRAVFLRDASTAQMQLESENNRNSSRSTSALHNRTSTVPIDTDLDLTSIPKVELSYNPLCEDRETELKETKFVDSGPQSNLFDGLPSDIFDLISGDTSFGDVRLVDADPSPLEDGENTADATQTFHNSLAPYYSALADTWLDWHRLPREEQERWRSED